MNPKNSGDLIRRVLGALENEPLVNLHDGPVEVALRGGELVLEGKLADIAAKRMAVATARRVAESVPVLDLLRIRPGECREDDQLLMELCGSLTQEPVFKECTIIKRRDGETELLQDAAERASGRIELQAHDGVVRLSGQVISLSHRRLAEVLCWWISGCENVDNRLVVVPPEEDNDGEIADGVEIVLEKDPLVHASQLAIRVEDRIVTLDGYVASQEEKRLAVLDAWYVPGVRDVVDRIEART